MISNPLLKIENLTTEFSTVRGPLVAVDQLNLNLPRGKITALVGESGCGKSATALSILRLIAPPAKISSGAIKLYDEFGTSSIDLLTLPEEKMRAIRGNRISMIFQEPMTSLNPVMTVGEQIAESVCLHHKLTKKEGLHEAVLMLQKVGISNPEKRIHDYPHQMSGGMRQRVMIAMALICKPELLIADEPTTALDVTIQAQIMALLKSLIVQMDMTCLLITHDLGLVAEFADRIAVMYAGQIVEEDEVINLFKKRRHPYTQGLLASIPQFDSDTTKKLYAIPGQVPDLVNPIDGCRFASRCEKVKEDCVKNKPELEKDGTGQVRCFYPNYF